MAEEINYASWAPQAQSYPTLASYAAAYNNALGLTGGGNAVDPASLAGAYQGYLGSGASYMDANGDYNPLDPTTMAAEQNGGGPDTYTSAAYANQQAQILANTDTGFGGMLDNLVNNPFTLATAAVGTAGLAGAFDTAETGMTGISAGSPMADSGTITGTGVAINPGTGATINAGTGAIVGSGSGGIGGLWSAIQPYYQAASALNTGVSVLNGINGGQSTTSNPSVTVNGVTTPTWPTYSTSNNDVTVNGVALPANSSVPAPLSASQNAGIAASTIAPSTAPAGTTGPKTSSGISGAGGIAPTIPNFNSVNFQDMTMAPGGIGGIASPNFNSMNFQGRQMSAGGIAGGMTLPPLSAMPRHTPMHAPNILGPRHMADGGIPSSSEADPWWTRQEARGMDHNGGLFNAGTAGRTDVIDANVPAGSHVIPADVVSGLGEGNTMAGSAVLDRMFHTGPGGMKLDAQKGRFGGPRPPSAYNESKSYAEGGRVPIVAAGGEYLVHPDAVKHLGGGDQKHGHKVLDHFIKLVRQKTAKKMLKLPPPKV